MGISAGLATGFSAARTSAACPTRTSTQGSTGAQKVLHPATSTASMLSRSDTRIRWPRRIGKPCRLYRLNRRRKMSGRGENITFLISSVKHTCRILFFQQAFCGGELFCRVRFRNIAAFRPNSSGHTFVLIWHGDLRRFLHPLRCQRNARVATDHDREVRGQTTIAGEIRILALGGDGCGMRIVRHFWLRPTAALCPPR